MTRSAWVVGAEVELQQRSCRVPRVGRAADTSPTRSPLRVFCYLGGILLPIPFVLAAVAYVRRLTDDTFRDCGSARRHAGAMLLGTGGGAQPQRPSPRLWMAARENQTKRYCTQELNM